MGPKIPPPGGAGGTPPSSGSPLQSASSGGAAGGPPPPPILKPWWETWAAGWQETSARLAATAKDMKPPDFSKGLGVKMDVDVLAPMLRAVKQTWQEIPEPIRQIAPFAGTGFLVATVATGLYREQLRLADARYDRLKREHADAVAKAAELERQVGGATAAAREAQLADALARVSTATAAAASAAATAASACALPAYEPAKTLQLLQRYGGPAYGDEDEWPPRRPQRRQLGGAAGPEERQWEGRQQAARGANGGVAWGPLALPWAGAGASVGGEGGGGIPSPGDITSEWSELLSPSGGLSSEVAGPVNSRKKAPKEQQRQQRARRRRGGASSGDAASEGAGAGGAGGGWGRGLEEWAKGASRTVAAPAAAAGRAFAQLPGWLGAQAKHAREAVEGAMRAARGGGG